MKRFLLLIILLVNHFFVYSQSPTILGVHGANAPTLLQNLGAKISRYGFSDYQIKNAIDSNFTQAINRAIELNNLNIKQVVYLTWPENSTSKIQRVPVGSDSIEVFQYLDIFIDQIGPYIDYFQISQEPLGLTKYDMNNYSIQQILDWWRGVVTFIRQKQNQNQNVLGHIKIITGGINSIHNAINNPNSTFASSIDTIISFGESYCDAIDLHLHVTDLAMANNNINYIRNRTNYTLTCTEWSQARAATSEGTGWLDSINTAFPNHPVFSGLTNYKVIDTSSVDTLLRMTNIEWDNFISTSPFTINFIQDFYSIMDSNCFEFACYGGGTQYGNPKFDWKQLYATLTVQNQYYPYPNYPFFQEYITLSNLLNTGQYTSNCSPLGIIKHKENYQQLNVYPNPFSNEVNIEFDNNNETVTLTVYNVIGEKVFEKSDINTSKVRMKRETLANGIYFVKIFSGGQIMGVGKLIIE